MKSWVDGAGHVIQPRQGRLTIAQDEVLGLKSWDNGRAFEPSPPSPLVGYHAGWTRLSPQEEIVMGHTYISALIHCVFSTKNREPLLDPEIRERLWPFIGGIARDNRIIALEVGGQVDHAHMLLSLPATIPIAKAMQIIKTGSSLFVKETFSRSRPFSWQEGYGAFSVSISARENTMHYIRNQEDHHKRKHFRRNFWDS